MLEEPAFALSMMQVWQSFLSSYFLLSCIGITPEPDCLRALWNINPFPSALPLWGLCPCHSPKSCLTVRARLAGIAAVMAGREWSEVACGQTSHCWCFVPCHFHLGLDSPIWSVSTNTAINSRAMLRQDSAPGMYRCHKLEVWGCKSHKKLYFSAEIPQNTSC